MANRSKVSEGILLATASAAAYAVAFSYREGYASHFGFPPVLLSPSLGAVLQAAGVVAVALMYVWNIAVGIWPWAPRGNSAKDRAVRRILIIGLIAAALIFQAFDGRQAWAFLAGIVGFFAFFEFVFPLIVHRNISNFEDKLIAQEDVEKNAKKHSLHSRISSVIGEDMLRLAVVISVLILLAYLVGLRNAKNQTEFYMLTDRPGQIVAIIEDDVIVLAAFDEKTSKLSGQYQVERLSDSHPWIFEKRKIGRLSSPSPAAEAP